MTSQRCFVAIAATIRTQQKSEQQSEQRSHSNNHKATITEQRSQSNDLSNDQSLHVGVVRVTFMTPSQHKDKQI